MAARTIPGRASSPQHLHVVDVLLDYAVNPTQLNSSAGFLIGNFPVGALILGCSVSVVTALSGGSPAAKFGITSGGVELVANSAYAAAAIGAITAPNTITGLIDRLTAETPIWYKDTGAATTAGKLWFRAFYSMPYGNT